MKALIVALALAATIVPAAHAGTQTAAASTPAPAATYGAPIALDDAQAIIARAVSAARAAGHRMAIAIVEPSGELIAFARMDDTQYGSTLVAQRKAATAARYRQPTATMEERTQAGRIVTLANDDALPIGGGIPIVVNGRIVGAIGVSGASAADDVVVATAALSAE